MCVCVSVCVKEETSYHLSGKCCAYMVSRYIIMAAHTMEPEELGKLRPSTLLQFARATKRFSWPLDILGLCIGPNIHGLSAGRLRPSAPKVKVKVCLCEPWSYNKSFHDSRVWAEPVRTSLEAETATGWRHGQSQTTPVIIIKINIPNMQRRQNVHVKCYKWTRMVLTSTVTSSHNQTKLNSKHNI